MCTLPLPTLHIICFRCQNDSAHCEAPGIEEAVAEEPIKLGNRRKKAAGIREIADAFRISIGTVDPALHNCPGVNLKAKAQVFQMAEQLGYQLNIATRSLKLNRKIRIMVVLHTTSECLQKPRATLSRLKQHQTQMGHYCSRFENFGTLVPNSLRESGSLGSEQFREWPFVVPAFRKQCGCDQGAHYEYVEDAVPAKPACTECDE